MKNLSISLLATTILFITSCATLFTGTKDKITFNSEPSGATIYIDGVEQCKTPCTMTVKRSISDTEVEFKLDGYETRLITLSKELNLVSIINTINLAGWGIDVLSGAVMKYDRKSYDITLDNKKTSMINPTRINIDTKNKIVELFVVEN
ncbi:MAG: PEGA domain-containing protein [Crocinitomicaceae bacterium]